MMHPVPAQFYHLFPTSWSGTLPNWIQQGGILRLVVTGARNWPEVDATIVRRALSCVHAAMIQTGSMLGIATTMVVVDGKCPYGGVDRYAYEWASHWSGLGIVSERFEPRIVNGRVMGPERNERMVGAGADLGIAFPMPGSRGTIDCLGRLFEHQVPTWVINYNHGYANEFRSGKGYV